MRDEHIIDLLETKPLSEMSEDEALRVRAHAEACAECRSAFEAAQISGALVRERAAERFEPPPFFQTRVMAAWRERQAANEQWALWRLWKTAGALVSSMAATVAMLAVLTFVAPTQQNTQAPTGDATDFASLSAEEVIMDEDNQATEQMNYEQVFTTLYGADEDE